MLLAPYPGGPASRNPRTSTLAGVGSLRAGPDGVVVGRFGWANALTGLVSNAPGDDDTIESLGLIAPTPGYWRWAAAWAGLCVPPGTALTLFSSGDFWVRFRDGAEPSARVYVSLVDGEAIAAYTQPDEAVITPWSVVIGTEPGGLAVISTWSTFL